MSSDEYMVDFSAFGSHFLESMLEMNMTEEPTTIEDTFNNQPGTSNEPINNICGENEEEESTDKEIAINPYNVISTQTLNKSTDSADDLDYRIKKNILYRQLFPPNLVKEVFEVKDNPLIPSTEFGDEEFEFYNSTFPDVSTVQYASVHCTICNSHIGCGGSSIDVAKCHTVLRVLVCSTCFQFYGDGNFPRDDSDGSEIYCRWCGEGGVLVCCSYCPKVFCKKCIKRNLGAMYVRKIEIANDWACVCCAVKPIWPLRALCWALMKYISNSVLLNTIDKCKCCAVKKLPGNKPIMPQPPLAPLASATKKTKTPVITSVKQYSVTQKNPPPLITLDESKTRIINKHITVRTPAARQLPALTPTTRTPAVLRRLPDDFVPANLCTPVLGQISTVRPIQVAKPQQVLQVSPISNLTPAKPLTTPVVFTTLPSTSTVNSTNIATAKVPVNPNNLVLRMKLPNGSMFLVRLVTDEKASSNDDGIKMPEFKSKLGEKDFFESALMDTFKLEKMVYDRMMILKKLHDTKTVINEKEIMSTISKKMHFILSKASDLFSVLDKSLQKEFEEWKLKRKINKTQEVDVIDLSDEEDSNTFKIKDGAGFSSVFSSKMSDAFKEEEELDKNGCSDELDRFSVTDSVKSDDADVKVIGAVVGNRTENNEDNEHKINEIVIKKLKVAQKSDVLQKFNIKECKVDLKKNNLLRKNRNKRKRCSDSESDSKKKTKTDENSDNENGSSD